MRHSSPKRPLAGFATRRSRLSWTEEDYEEVEDWDEPVITDATWPAKREALDATKARVLALAELLIYLDVDVQLVEPDEEMVDLLRKMVRLEQ